jgi:phosphoribosylaminoimidazolecarboxamide formyltransferase / IMP cyclohydrolase
MAKNIVDKIKGQISVNRVLVSVSDKNGLADFIAELIKTQPNIKFYSTGGTYNVLKETLPQPEKNLVKVSAYTGQPEMQGGLVKTLDFKIYLGLLSESYNNAHDADIQRVNGVKMDMVIVNLYPFTETVARQDTTAEHARANIDIGGHCMIRAAAKNFLRVAAVTKPADYAKICEEMRENQGHISLETRFNLAKKAFAHTATYDNAIAHYFNSSQFENIRKCYNIVN